MPRALRLRRELKISHLVEARPSIEDHAAVHEDRLAGDVTRVGAGEERNDTGHFRRFGHALQGDPLGELFPAPRLRLAGGVGGLLRQSSISGVLTMPGAYVLTVMPYFARSRAAVCVKPRTANFVAEYRAMPGLPTCPACDAALMMRPPCPRALKARVAACVPQTTPLKLIENSFSMVSGVISSIGDGGAMPALLMITSKPSSCATAWSTAAKTLSRSATLTRSAMAPAALPPSAAATFSAASTLRSAIATRKPSACSRSAMASPMPWPPPVTSATLP